MLVRYVTVLVMGKMTAKIYEQGGVMMRRIIYAASLLMIMLTIIIWPVPARGQDEQALVYTVNVEDTVTSGTAKNIKRAIDYAQSQNADALVILINTPGGLVDATLDIIQDMSRAEIPVITYVTPQGAIAASAGTFILMGGHLAAMSPGTTCGAAMPVTMTAEGGGTEAADQKTINFLAEHMRSIAQERGRPGDIAEKFVLENLSLNNQEALKQGMIDAAAKDLEELLEVINGRDVSTAAGKIILNTGDAQIINLEMTTEEKLTHIISNPSLAVILLMLGIYGLIIAFSTPGFFLPVVLGSIFLILGLFGVGLFEVNLTAILLIVLGIVLLITELFTPTYGVLGVGGIVSIVLGILFLPVEPLMPGNWFTAFKGMAIGTGIVGAGFVFIVIRGVFNLRKIKPMQGEAEFADSVGIVIDPLNPLGQVRIRGEIWQAVSKNGEIPAGNKVKVIARDGINLVVERSEDFPD